jgi:hypothetical protein
LIKRSEIALMSECYLFKYSLTDTKKRLFHCRASSHPYNTRRRNKNLIFSLFTNGQVLPPRDTEFHGCIVAKKC